MTDRYAALRWGFLCGFGLAARSPVPVYRDGEEWGAVTKDLLTARQVADALGLKELSFDRLLRFAEAEQAHRQDQERLDVEDDMRWRGLGFAFAILHTGVTLGLAAYCVMRGLEWSACASLLLGLLVVLATFVLDASCRRGASNSRSRGGSGSVRSIRHARSRTARTTARHQPVERD